MNAVTHAPRRWVPLALGTVVLALACGAWSAEPTRQSFAWKGTLNVPSGASMARVALPPEALARMQSSTLNDVRVFNAADDSVAFAMVGVEPPSALPAVHTRTYPAFGLYASAAAQSAPAGAVEVRVEGGASGSAWVRWGNTKALDAGAAPLQAALFDMRSEKQAVAALQVQAQLPANSLVHMQVASSTDLNTWRPLLVRGPLFKFEGTDAPVNTTLELQAPASLEGHYLRLTWEGQGTVKVASLRGVVSGAVQEEARVKVVLPNGTVDAGKAQTWPLEFATPMAALHLESLQDNTLIPLRIVGRADPSQPWRTLGHTVVYRLNDGGQIRANGPVLLRGTSTRWLRVEATNGLPLPAGGLQATVEFAPVQLAFLATGQAPFTLAVGRADTPAMAVDAAMLASIAPARLQELPVASVQVVRADAPGAPNVWVTQFLPNGMAMRTALLWGVLLLGVVVLALVAASLLRQLAKKPDA